MNTLQNYYGMAIRQNKGQLYQMKKAIAALIFHCSEAQTNDERHLWCPQTPQSWCKYQADKLTGKKTHKDKITLDKAVADIIKPIFGPEDLGADELLKKCLHGKTQNVKESINNIIWTRRPKRIYVGRSTLEMGVGSAVINFNDGGLGLIPVFESAGIDPGYYTRFGLKDLDKTRITEMNRKTSEWTKKARKRLRAIRKGFIDNEKEEEGEVYASGCF